MRKLFLIGEEKRKGRSEANTKLETTCVFLQYKGILKVCLSFQQYIYTTIVANSFKKAGKLLRNNLLCTYTCSEDEN